MKKLYFLPMLIVLINFAYSQKHFPEKCVGDWEGKMIMYNQGEAMDTIDVVMTIAPIPDTLGWTWKTVYLNLDKSITKDYNIYVNEESPNGYLLDENDGATVLNSYVFDNKMYSNFMVQNSLLTSIYTLEEDRLSFEICSGINIGKTGNDISNYSITFLQTSLLSRVD